MRKQSGFDAAQHRRTKREALPPGMARQLQRLVTEERPGACVGCQIQKDCARCGCYALRKVSSVVGEKGSEKHDVARDRPKEPTPAEDSGKDPPGAAGISGKVVPALPLEKPGQPLRAAAVSPAGAEKERG